MQLVNRPTRPTTAPVVIGLLTLIFVLAACGSAGDAAHAEPDASHARERPASGEAADHDAGDAMADEESSAGGDGRGEMDAFAAPIEQQIVRTGDITLEVENVATSLARVRAMVRTLGGYVGGSEAGTLDESATLILRIPADRFTDALARLHDLDGEVVAESTREEDVTGQIVDLEARISNLRASEESYRALLARAERIDDVLAVQMRLDEVRGQIEQLEAQLENVVGRAQLATLTVTLLPAPEPIQTQAETWNPGSELNRALASLVAIGQAIANGLIWFAIVWLPILLVLTVLAALAIRGVLEVRRRVPQEPVSQPPAR